MAVAEYIDPKFINRLNQVVKELCGAGKKYRFVSGLCTAIGMTPQGMNLILKQRKQMMSRLTLVELAKVENISLDWLCLGRGDMYYAKPTNGRATAKPVRKSPAKKAAKKNGTRVKARY